MSSASQIRRQALLHIFFRVAVLLKGMDGVLETAGGVILLSVDRQSIRQVVHGLLQHELLEDPNDPMASYLERTASQLSASTKMFAAAYLLAHGLVKLVMATALWWYKLWAYPLAGVILSLFALFQIIRFTSTHSILLLLLTAVDLFIIGLLPAEYRRTARLKKAAHPQNTR